MPIDTVIVTWVHLLAASIWVGGTLFIALVLNPVLRRLINDDGMRIEIIINVGRRFNRVAIPVIALLIGTGVYNSLPYLSAGFVFTPYTIILSVKVGLVISMLLVWLVHARISNNISSGTDKGIALKIRSRAITLGKVLGIQAVSVLLLAAILDSL